MKIRKIKKTLTWNTKCCHTWIINLRKGIQEPWYNAQRRIIHAKGFK
jgi:hypothetical protein